MPLQKRLLKFHCQNCRDNELVDLLKSTVEDKEKIIDSQDEIIRLLREKLSGYEASQGASKCSYAEALSGNSAPMIERRLKCPSVLIKPKVAQDAVHTKKDISQSINPMTLGVSVRNLQMSRNGMVVVKCSGREDSQLLVDAVRSSLGAAYTVELSKLRKPRIKIPGFNQNMSEAEIENSIKQQNRLQGDIRVVYVRKKSSGAQTIFCECSSGAFSKLMELKKICIGWERYPVFEDLGVPRCFHCQAYYHKKGNCRNDLVCARCGGAHESRGCSSQVKSCRNCIAANERYGKEYEANHEATDVNCPVLRHYVDVLRSKTDYLS